MSSIINIKVTKQEALNAIEAYYKDRKNKIKEVRIKHINSLMSSSNTKFLWFNIKTKPKAKNVKEAIYWLKNNYSDYGAKCFNWSYWDDLASLYPPSEQVETLHNIIKHSKVDFTVTINEHIKELIPFLE